MWPDKRRCGVYLVARKLRKRYCFEKLRHCWIILLDWEMDNEDTCDSHVARVRGSRMAAYEIPSLQIRGAHGPVGKVRIVRNNEAGPILMINIRVLQHANEISFVPI